MTLLFELFPSYLCSHRGSALAAVSAAGAAALEAGDADEVEALALEPLCGLLGAPLASARALAAALRWSGLPGDDPGGAKAALLHAVHTALLSTILRSLPRRMIVA